MTAPRDPDQLIRAFLEDGRTELPDRSYDAVRGQIDRTRQRVVIGPWREPRVSNTAKIALAAAAVVAVVVIGINLLPGGSGGVGAAPSSSPTPAPPAASPSSVPPTASPAPTLRTLTTSDIGSNLAPGTYRVGEPFGKPFTLTVDGNRLGALGQAEVAIDHPGSPAQYGIYIPNGTYADPCATGATPQPAPTTVAGLVEAFGAMRGFRLDASTDVTLDGHPGKAIVLTNTMASGAQCPFGPWIPIFSYAGGPAQGAATNRGLTEYLWIIDVAGTPVVVATSTNASSFDQLDPIIQSIQFDE